MMVRPAAVHGARWDSILPNTPWSQRRVALRALFEGIAPQYDRLNRFLSLGLDERWRARAAQEALGEDGCGVILDLASGTGDLAARVIHRAPRATVLRLDLSALLLRRGGEKLGDHALSPPVVAEMERLPIRPGSCAAITMGYALRHVESLEALCRACAEALRPGGCVAFVDMDLPHHSVWARLYGLYFRWCLPRFAALLGGEREAYQVLVASVESFAGWDALARVAAGAGLVGVRRIRLTGGAASVFVARMPENVVRAG
jgi:demethylmenaquinone methyltransferase/2-methoxy-6-polyprenyl-1,4-benzoquinol methylase